MSFYSRCGVLTPFDPSFRLVTSPILSPGLLFLVRLFVAVYTFVALIFDLAWQGAKLGEAGSWFSYFTKLSYIGLCAYFCASAVQSFAFVQSSKNGDLSYPLQRWPRVLQFLHILLFGTIITFPILVVIVYWALLSSSSTFASAYSTWSNLSYHALNVLGAIFELVFSRIVIQWTYVPFLVLVLAGYLGVAYITYAAQGFYTYSFLNPGKQGGLLAAYIVGIAVGEVILFGIAWGIIRARVILSKDASVGVAAQSDGDVEKAYGDRL